MQISKIINNIDSIKINSFVLKKIIIPKKIHNELKKFFLNNKEINILDLKLDFLKKTIPLFSNFVIEKKIYLENPGYFVFDIDNKNIYNLNEKKKIYLIIGKLLGGFLSQNSNGDYLVEVKDKGKTLKNGARYHESNEAGNLHTDSPQWNKTPSVVGLYCHKPAIKGGDSVLVDSFALLKEASKNKTILKNLFEKYHFDKRGDLKINDKSETTFASIFSYDKNMFRFRIT